ncbi:phosphate regulon sensor histidine kinase PhoR [Methylophaga sp. OBS4]|uniref:phosphate regulon sensor histidine kinase PhoR n=1 Tax=Methylophaga sp. OBS4 TaxID=2991935 RepID=UPI002253B241|nr:phosphate regulon sensor histidine kinase PhoR [Methylophaga sp. OBS4]MCX4186421.1 phosphate regulon sensor histidine kinase PhoR [Methylophaga sp. OBS4]
MQWDNWRLLTLISLAGFVGLLFGQMMTFMFLASLGYALWLQHNWYKLWYWLQKPKKRRSPSAEGVIDDVCRQIEQMRQQNSNRKKKLTGYLQRFQSATSALPDAIVVLGEFGEVDWANQAARELLGIRWPRDSNVRVNNLIRDPAFQQLLEDPMRQGGMTTVKSPLNSEVQLELKLVKYMGGGRLLIARDITQTIKLQRMRRDFVANVSHELKTPLTVLRGYLEAFSADSDSEQWRAALPAMRQQSERMHLMIKDLLVLSQLETGEKALRRIPTDVGKLLQAIIDDAHSTEHYRDQRFTLNLDTDKWLICDVDELRSAISNLVFNAVKYTPPACQITLNWREEDEAVCIEVSDDGEGIAEHHLERLTERFYRVDKGRSNDAGGTGLGLAIVKHVLQRHGANLVISSEQGKGSSFKCCFPKTMSVEKITV